MILERIYHDEIKISVEQTQIFMDAYRKKQGTGIIRLAIDEAKQVFLLIKRGTVINAYQIKNGSKEGIGNNWMQIIEAQSSFYLRQLPVSTFAVQIIKILIESNNAKTSEYTAAKILESAGQNALAEISHLSSQESEAVLFSCNNPPEIYSVYIAPEQTEDTSSVSEKLRWLASSEHKIEIQQYSPNLDIPAWQEYFLRCATGRLIHETLTRYESITGRAMTDSASRAITVAASHEKLDISVHEKNVVDNEFFSSPAEAAEAYKKLLKIMMSQISSVIGNRILTTTMIGAAGALRPMESQMAQSFNLIEAQYFSQVKRKELFNG